MVPVSEWGRLGGRDVKSRQDGPTGGTTPVSSYRPLRAYIAETLAYCSEPGLMYAKAVPLR